VAGYIIINKEVIRNGIREEKRQACKKEKELEER
jgi:hypothetical protein